MGFWDKMIGKKIEEKATEIHRAIVRFFGAKEQWSDRHYDNFAKEGYNMNVWVFACVQAIATGVANIPWVLYQVDSKGERQELTEHPLLDLLKKPNEFTSQSELIEAYAAFLLIAGNSYMEINKPYDSNTDAMELNVLRPDRIQVMTDSENFIKGYKYTLGGEIVDLPADRVAHLKTFHPLNDFYGLSPVEPAARGIDNNNEASAWNNALLTNGARPSGALISEQPLTEHQYNMMQESMAKNHQGSANAGKPLLLEGGLKWQDMSMSPRDMDFIASKKLTTVEICAAFRVPPEIVGFAETKTYSNYQEARKALYEDAIIPCFNKIRDKFNNTIVAMYGDNLELDADLDSIEALQENRDAVYDRAIAAYQGGIIKQNEARNEMGYDDDPEGDKYFTPPVAPVVPGKEEEKPPAKKSRFF